MAARGLQDDRLGLRLDALSGHRQAQGVSDMDRGANQPLGLLAAVNTRDQAAIDLQDGEGEQAQKSDARIAGAEIVQRQPYSELAQVVENFACLFGFQDNRLLGDFEDQPRGRESGFVQDIFDKSR